ncbi:MAG: tRNA preQ1(34) S-adenosylmethionine ribosyltransferase-isomerase QueA [Alphaproteobacteria bacterium]|nr:tRNA preQ1(34) S-adenosylmethionine ribosyltransferase-isomerase QueA [Alphaproteobacteria bacterium]
MKTADFDFDLPPDRIAQTPARPRDSARLLVVEPGRLIDRWIRDLPDLLRPGDLLVFNDTRVIPALLEGRRGDAKVSFNLHRRAADDEWIVFARPAKKLKPEDRVTFGDGLEGRVVAREGGEVRLKFSVGGAALGNILNRIGRMPLPPYIRRKEGQRPEDQADYQTMFARAEGAVAAPTAGLHFTPALIRTLDDRGIARVTLTLHVGAGTFLPVTAEDTSEHRMHAEYGEITREAAAAINAARARGGRIVAVGSTPLRLMESAADESGTIKPFAGETAIFITPGYRFRTAELMLTNFHLPRSTLFMLVAAFAGLDRMRGAYAHAIVAGYRFYSYGDACLLSRAA